MRLSLLALGLLFVAASPLYADPAIEVETDVVYGKGGPETLHLDIAQPKGKGPFPGVIAIHGGSWRAGDKRMFRPVLTRLAKEGFVAVSIQYRFAPKYAFPAQIEDSKCAVRWMRANAKKLKLDPTRIGAIGFSAGAHLALLLGTMDGDDGLEGKGGHRGYSSKVQCVVNYFGPTDIRQFSGRTIEEFMGGKKSERGEWYAKASPLVYIDKGDAPVLTLHGTRDRLVPYRQAIALKQKLTEVGVDNRLWTAEGAGHGWGGEKLEESYQESLKFLKKYLMGELKVKRKARLY